MIKSIFIVLLAFTFQADARMIHTNNETNSLHKKTEEILTNIFYEQLYKRIKNTKPDIEVKKLKKSPNEGRRGNLIIQEMLQRNREAIAKKRGIDPSKAKSGNSIINIQKNENKVLVEKINFERKKLEEKYAHLPLEKRKSKIWQVEAQKELDDIKKKVIGNHNEWKKKYKETLINWKRSNINYKKEIPSYKQTLIDIPLILPVSKKDVKKELSLQIIKDHKIVTASFSMPIRDQKKRPTCSSFSGIRAVETLLHQNNFNYNLSEQYFYWASKPKCQSRPCRSRGSWVGHGLRFSKDSRSLDIPLESNCPYRNNTILRNETQTPLAGGCRKGKVKVRDYTYHENLDGMVGSLRANKPIIASVKLTPNFYDNDGIILDSESNKGFSKMNSHASGHSILIVGYLKLPKVLHEGSVCFIIANSWGLGWGHGGHACISEKWLLKNRQRNPFVSIGSVEI
jgi:C1A family cysteine protease